jgi:hypothetical protein
MLVEATPRLRTAGLAVSVAVLLALGTSARAAETDAPRHVLASGGLKLTLYLPDARTGYYRGTRFDWSGLVARAEVGGHTVFCDWVTPHSPTFPGGAPGTAEEFGNGEPLGYSEAPVGGTFLKIGVGELEKPAEPKYDFNRAYKIVRPGAWTVTTGERVVEFRQEMRHPTGYGYRYTKRVELAERGFAIRRTLANTGARPIDTDHYGHHFLTVDGEPIGPDYALRFDFPARAKLLDGLRDATELRDGRLVFLRPLDMGSVYLEITGWGDRAEDNRVTVEHAKSGLALHIQGDRPLAKFNVWSVRTTLCPEPFVRLVVEPGREVSWTSRYEFTLSRP